MPLGTLLSRTGILDGIKPLHDVWRTHVVMLAYHRVMPLPSEDDYPYDMGLISANPEDFDWQMSVLRRDYDPIPLSDIVLFTRGRAKLPRRPVIVTFDDGYADNYEHAFPAMRRHGIPATIFVTVGRVGTRRLMWHDLAAFIAIRGRGGQVPTLDGPLALNEADTPAQRRAAARRFLSYLKTIPHAQLQTLLEQLSLEHAAELSATDHAPVRMLSWEQINEMAGGGIEFGSHTMTHGILSHLSPQELRAELAESKAILEQRLARPCTTIAYPVGRSSAFNSEALAEVGLAGYRLGVAYNPGANRSHSLDLYALRRQAVELSTTRTYFRAMLSLPSWFH